MIGSLVTTNCSCQNCCSAEYATPTPDNLPDQIAVQYSGVPSFLNPIGVLNGKLLAQIVQAQSICFIVDTENPHILY